MLQIFNISVKENKTYGIKIWSTSQAEAIEQTDPKQHYLKQKLKRKKLKICRSKNSISKIFRSVKKQRGDDEKGEEEIKYRGRVIPVAAKNVHKQKNQRRLAAVLELSNFLCHAIHIFTFWFYYFSFKA